MLTKFMHKRFVAFGALILIAFIIAAVVYQKLFAGNDPDDGNSNTATALVSVISAPTAPFAPSINAYGSLSPAPSNFQSLMSQSNAVIKRIAVAPYTAVKKGQKLLEIMPTQDVIAQLQNAQANFKHLQALRKQYLATNNDVAAAEANLTSLKAQYGNGIKWLTAPADGVVGAIMVQPGQVTSSGTALLNFSKKSQIGASLSLAPNEQTQVKVGDLVTLQALDNANLQLNGVVSSVASQINDQSGLIDVEVTLQNVPNNLIINTPVQAEIAIQAAQSCIILPRNAVLYQGNQAYVFLDQNNKAVYRQVTVAGSAEDKVAISSGLNVGDMVVTTGNYELEDGMPLAIQGSNS